MYLLMLDYNVLAGKHVTESFDLCGLDEKSFQIRICIYIQMRNFSKTDL